MDFCTYFYKDIGLFGGYPLQDQVNELIKEGVAIFLDLTTPEDKLPRYTTSNSSIYINYPIPDGSTPSKSILKLLLLIRDYILENRRIYIHCKGGHGRSGMVAAGLLCLLNDISPYDSIKHITESHRSRKNLKSKWLTKLCPHQRNQQQWIYGNFGKTIITHYNDYNIFNLFNTNEIIIKGKTFDKIAQLFLFFANINTDESDFQISLKNIRKRYSVNYLNFIMHKAYSCLIKSDTKLQDLLIATGLKKIYYICEDDNYWGFNKNIGNNYIGKILEVIRLDYIHEKIN